MAKRRNRYLGSVTCHPVAEVPRIPRDTRRLFRNNDFGINMDRLTRDGRNNVVASGNTSTFQYARQDRFSFFFFFLLLNCQFFVSPAVHCNKYFTPGILYYTNTRTRAFLHLLTSHECTSNLLTIIIIIMIKIRKIFIFRLFFFN